MKVTFGIMLHLLAFGLQSAQCFATVFAGDDGREVVEKEPQFLERIGVSVFEEEVVGEEGNSNLQVTFTSSDIQGYEDIGVEFIYLDAKNQILLSVEKPFANSPHTTRYLIPPGHTLLVSVVAPLSRDSKYYKVVLKN
ncbi:hypothetical protein [Microbulbifer halophilus]|uniref:Uncharacterized protein n=1 Tax=Microbulbifer halophilus TaxID=453963 RepID=A0ABW5ECM5_9GAMM|nr:hypothetical protein [Microbulbifer halophilus]MCW8126229.1 hypothetical protein [Microbulbifer halophilus]